MSEATNFIARQQSARTGTFWLVFLFILGIAALTVVPSLLISFGSNSFDPNIFIGVFIFIVAGVGITTLFKIWQLSGGGKVIAQAMGGRLMDSVPRNPEERKLRNVVEEMAIASGVPVPEIYVLDNEEGINAFAAGYSPADAVIGVTRGAITNLNREELQGVIAHEFSHILNGDMRLNIRLIGFIAGLFFFTLLGRILIDMGAVSSSRKDEKGGGVPLMLIGIISLLLGAISVFFGKIIQAAVSRKREHLADASAVEFTRNPMGLASALKKIGAIQSHSYIKSSEATEASHLFFAQGVNSFWSRVFATHPPLTERIRLLDPTFDGDYSKVLTSASEQSSSEERRAKRVSTNVGRNSSPRGQDFITGAVGTAVILGSDKNVNVSPISGAHDLLESLPADFRSKVNDTLGAIEISYAVLLDSTDSTIYQVQLEKIEEVYGDVFVKQIVRTARAMISISRSQKLALISLCISQLHKMSSAQLRTFIDVLHALVLANGEVDVFEYCVLKTIDLNLNRYFSSKKKKKGKAGVRDLSEHLEVILSILVRTEAGDEREAERAFDFGGKVLGLTGSLHLKPVSDCGFENLDIALETVAAQASEEAKAIILKACEAVVASTNGQISDDEANLIRAIRQVFDA